MIPRLSWLWIGCWKKDQSNQLIKNLSTITEHEKQKPKDWGSNLDVVWNLKRLYTKSSAVFDVNKLLLLLL